MPLLEYIDAVTVHDYSLKPNLIENLNETEALSYTSVYGQSALPQFIGYVKNRFPNKEMWITEYNWNGVYPDSEYQVLHAMFLSNYIATSICNSDTMKHLMMHLFSSQVGNQWVFHFINIHGYILFMTHNNI